MLLFLGLLLASLYLWSYGDCLGAFFHFDDFWVLAAVDGIHIRSPLDVVQFFKPIHGFLLYRPISTLLYFYLIHLSFGYNPLAYHAIQIAFHVLNALLVYALADTLLLSRPLSLAAALIYATAPGHAIAACWNALFTVTGTAFFYFLGLWVWLRMDSRWRVPITFVVFIMALLSSEHAVSFPLVLTLASILLVSSPEWCRLVREQVAFYVVGGGYVAAKLYYLRYQLASAFPSPAAQAYARAGYEMSLRPQSLLTHLGEYVGFTVDAAYAIVDHQAAALGLGAVLAVLAAACVVCVLTRRWTARALRVGAFGLGTFIVALGPVLCLPNHRFSYYVGIAAFGLSVAIVAFAAALPRFSRPVQCLIVATVLSVHVFSTSAAVRRSEEFRFFDSFSTSAAGWLYAIAGRAARAPIDEVVIPRNQLTDMVFDVGHAHQLFLCARYQVHTVPIAQIQPRFDREILIEPSRVPRTDGIFRRWAWMREACSVQRRRESRD
jgi:hypothetical protein